VDVLDRRGVGRQMTVVDDRCRKRGLLQCDVQRIPATHAPADRADTVLVHIGLRLQEFDGGMQIAQPAVFGESRHKFARGPRIVRDLAAKQINRQGDIALLGKFRRLLLDPMVEPPIFVDHDERGKPAFARECKKNSLYGFVAALIADLFRGCSKTGRTQREPEIVNQQTFFIRVS
jgi:hypothetical protein